MPNHFHLLISTFGSFDQVKFSNGFKTLLSSYTNAINLQEQRTGSLFQQNSKAKCLSAETNRHFDDYGLVCFNYIHQNPVNAGLVSKLEEWEYSSFRDYAGLRKGTLCKKEIACDLIGVPAIGIEFYEQSYEALDEKKLIDIF